MKQKNIKDKWPKPEFNANDQPHFLFIITPPNSGSTALSELINSSHRTMVLQERGEGQWLIPGLCDNDRWDENKEIDYQSIKAVWLNKYQKSKVLDPNIDVVIEKSPPNMMRAKELITQFDHYSVIANNRNPYANCASMLYRHHDADSLNTDQRKEILGKLINGWIERSTKIQEVVTSLDVPLLTYEEFCKQPSLILKIVNLPEEIESTINLNAVVKVKDYKVQPIIDQNEKQISQLKEQEIEYMSRCLLEQKALLNFFGYELI